MSRRNKRDSTGIIADGDERRIAALVEDATGPVREEYERRLADAWSWRERLSIKREMRKEIRRVSAEVMKTCSGVGARAVLTEGNATLRRTVKLMDGLEPSELEIGATLTVGLIVALGIWEPERFFCFWLLLFPVVVLVSTLVVIVWVDRLVRVLWRWPERRDSLLRHKAGWAVLPFVVMVLATLAWLSFGPRSFDQGAWLSVEVNSNDDIRWRMVDDLRERHLRLGMAKTEVFALLGPPDMFSSSKPPDPEQVWWLSAEWLDQRWLVVTFESGRLVSTEVDGTY